MTTEDRLQQLADNAATLRELSVPPTEQDKNNVKVYRAVYSLGRALVSASLIIKVGEPPLVQVTKRFGDSLTGSQMLTGPTVTAEDHAVFLGLDECTPRTPPWRLEKGNQSNLVVVRGAIGQPVNGARG